MLRWTTGQTGAQARVGEMMYGSPESGGPSQSQEQHTACEEFTALHLRHPPSWQGPEWNKGTGWGLRCSLPFSRCSTSLWVNLAQALQESRGWGCGLWPIYSPNRISFWF